MRPFPDRTLWIHGLLNNFSLTFCICNAVTMQVTLETAPCQTWLCCVISCVCLDTLGYFSDTKATIVVIAACYLPDRSIKNYDFLMEQLFLWVCLSLIRYFIIRSLSNSLHLFPSSFLQFSICLIIIIIIIIYSYVSSSVILSSFSQYTFSSLIHLATGS